MMFWNYFRKICKWILLIIEGKSLFNFEMLSIPIDNSNKKFLFVFSWKTSLLYWTKNVLFIIVLIVLSVQPRLFSYTLYWVLGAVAKILGSYPKDTKYEFRNMKKIFGSRLSR